MKTKAHHIITKLQKHAIIIIIMIMTILIILTHKSMLTVLLLWRVHGEIHSVIFGHTRSVPDKRDGSS